MQVEVGGGAVGSVVEALCNSEESLLCCKVYAIRGLEHILNKLLHFSFHGLLGVNPTAGICAIAICCPFGLAIHSSKILGKKMK